MTPEIKNTNTNLGRAGSLILHSPRPGGTFARGRTGRPPPPSCCTASRTRCGTPACGRGEKKESPRKADRKRADTLLVVDGAPVLEDGLALFLPHVVVLHAAARVGPVRHGRGRKRGAPTRTRQVREKGRVRKRGTLQGHGVGPGQHQGEVERPRRGHLSKK